MKLCKTAALSCYYGLFSFRRQSYKLDRLDGRTVNARVSCAGGLEF